MVDKIAMFKKTFLSLSNIVLGQFIVFIYTLIAIRNLSPAQLGQSMSSLALAMIFATTLDFGYTQSHLRSYSRLNSGDFRIMNLRNVRTSFLTMCAAAISFVFFNNLISLSLLVGLLWQLSVQSSIPFRAVDNLIELFLRSAIGRILGLSFATLQFLAVKEPASYVTGVGIVYLFEICALSIWSHARHKVASEGNILDAATSVIPVIQQFDTIIIHRFSAEEAGYFSAVSKWPALFANLVSALNFANYKENANNLYTRTEWMRGLFPYFKAYVILSVLVIGFASALIHILIGPNYEPSTQVFQVLMFVSVISFWNQSFYSRLTAQGKNLLLFSIYTPWTTIQLVLIGAMMKDQGLTKAVWVYPVAQLGMLIHFLIAAKE